MFSTKIYLFNRIINSKINLNSLNVNIYYIVS